MQNTAEPGSRPGASEAINTNTNGHHDMGLGALAEWISGAQWADELGVDPDSGIGEVLGENAWKAVRKFCRRYAVDVYHYGSDGMAFSDFEALPREVWRTASPKVELTRAQVAEFADDALTEDPHEIGEKLQRERLQRYRERDRAERALKAKSIPSDRLYTLDEVARVCGDNTADAVLAVIERANRRTWNTPKPHNHREHEYLITAAELYAKFHVAVRAIAMMTAATEQDQDAALDRLSLARARHRNDVTERAKAGDADPDDGTPLYADIAQLLDGGVPDPPTPDILRRKDGVGLFYRGEINLLYGDPEDGKTMVALAGCAEVLRDGGTVLFVDLDDNGVESIVTRLLMLGAPESALRAGRFRYCSPAGRDRLEQVIKDCTVDGQIPDVAVIDCVGELVPMFDGSNNDSDDFTRIIRATAGLLARSGVCVVLIDHMAKSTDSRKYGAGGTMAKRRRVGGTQLRVDVEVPLRKGQGGTLRLSIRKDRHSGLRQHCHPVSSSSANDGLQQAGRFIIDPGDTAWCVAVDPMVLSAEDGAPTHDGKHSRYIEAAQGLDEGWTITALAQRVHGDQCTEAQRKDTGRAVKHMIATGCVEKLAAGGKFKPATHRLMRD
ncbi:AAA family ATPase [Mycolicibacterium holsaticum]|uniref:AAA family ATPase n=1 Tax=Mycolicibacterium holsaticum TaxID=152142 RepID=UPI001C7CF82B|nr:AAA family ATPase [Mycolicibacterium holsaticum]MDA4108157.1 hypothetical protein [Mycolicibacterium holsaticum DSM 44478 = JCM 12374]QZA14433.1 AAA family ATPase [Mycolicibacterium holsaticum DSM 44478 = JCM 12374]UNC08117.1 AAA family ATPase [Mycolicibacterium holsaticum DSM 44478 = JCM 12374]